MRKDNEKEFRERFKESIRIRNSLEREEDKINFWEKFILGDR